MPGTSPTEITAVDLGFEPVTTHTATAFGLLRVTALLTDELERELQDSSGIGLSEMLVLIQLMLAGGRLKMAELASSLVVTRGGVTKIIDRLVHAGLVARAPSTSDRRVIYAEVTEAAKAVVRENQPLFDEIARRRLGELLDGDEFDQFAKLVDRLNCDNPGWEPPEAVLTIPATSG
jgi:DNA-binding MarR family transcriptional regulator